MNTEQHHVEMKHSGLGIASFITATVVAVMMFFTFIVAGYMSAVSPDGLDEKSIEAFVVGMIIIFLLFVELLAAGLGLAALFQSDRKKVFAALGLTCAVSVIVITLVLILVGLAQ